MPRKKVELPSLEYFEKCLKLGLNKVELASFLDLSTKAIDNYCKDNYNKTFLQLTNKKMGAPRKAFDFEQFESLCKIMCTEEEIADVFNCSVDTVNRRCLEHYGCTFAEIYKKLSANGRISLRRYQFELAKTLDRGMLIWLGKQWLGQRDYKQSYSEDYKKEYELKKDRFEHDKNMDEFKLG